MLPAPLHAAVVGMVVFGCYWMVDPALQDRDVYSHIVKGRCPELPEEAYRINRTEERAAVQKAILCTRKGFYYVITGPHGCGKSFLVQETVLELMTNSTPVPGCQAEFRGDNDGQSAVLQPTTYSHSQ